MLPFALNFLVTYGIDSGFIPQLSIAAFVGFNLWFLLIFPGAVAYTVIGAWYLYRCLRGWLRFNDNRFPE